jgi:hypothetical protein
MSVKCFTHRQARLLLLTDASVSDAYRILSRPILNSPGFSSGLFHGGPPGEPFPLRRDNLTRSSLNRENDDGCQSPFRPRRNRVVGDPRGFGAARPDGVEDVGRLSRGSSRSHESCSTSQTWWKAARIASMRPESAILYLENGMAAPMTCSCFQAECSLTRGVVNVPISRCGISASLASTPPPVAPSSRPKTRSGPNHGIGLKVKNPDSQR